MLKRYWWLLLLVLLSVPQLSFASEATYQITESELTQLENNLMELSDLNDRQSEMLSQQQIQLQESEKLQNQIYSLRKEMIEQENSLETARASLEWFEKEKQAKLNRAKQEKTAAWIIAGLLLCVCIGK